MMQTNLYPGKFIVVEGIDGSGKSTQVNFIADWIKNQWPELGRNLLITHEPHLSAQGKRLRDILKGRQTAPDSQLEMQKLYIEDRKEHIGNTILPRIKNGASVICDRYFLSTFTYGHHI